MRQVDQIFIIFNVSGDSPDTSSAVGDSEEDLWTTWGEYCILYFITLKLTLKVLFKDIILFLFDQNNCKMLTISLSLKECICFQEK